MTFSQEREIYFAKERKEMFTDTWGRVLIQTKPIGLNEYYHVFVYEAQLYTLRPLGSKVNFYSRFQYNFGKAVSSTGLNVYSLLLISLAFIICQVLRS